MLVSLIVSVIVEHRIIRITQAQVRVCEVSFSIVRLLFGVAVVVKIRTVIRCLLCALSVRVLCKSSRKRRFLVRVLLAHNRGKSLPNC